MLIKTLLRRLAALLLAPILLFEEWGWQPLARAMARIARLPLLAGLERRIARLPPWAALLAFGLPVVVLLPIKLLALWLMGAGQKALGVAVLVAAKLVGTAIVARLFQLTEPALMRLRWFARTYPRWKAWKDAVLARARAWLHLQPLWRGVRLATLQARRGLARWWRAG